MSLSIQQSCQPLIEHSSILDSPLFGALSQNFFPNKPLPFTPPQCEIIPPGFQLLGAQERLINHQDDIMSWCMAQWQDSMGRLRGIVVYSHDDTISVVDSLTTRSFECRQQEGNGRVYTSCTAYNPKCPNLKYQGVDEIHVLGSRMINETIHIKNSANMFNSDSTSKYLEKFRVASRECRILSDADEYFEPIKIISTIAVFWIIYTWLVIR